MALIKVKNPELYRRWLARLGSDTSAKRTAAFFNSQRGESPPLYG